MVACTFMSIKKVSLAVSAVRLIWAVYTEKKTFIQKRIVDRFIRFEVSVSYFGKKKMIFKNQKNIPFGESRRSVYLVVFFLFPAVWNVLHSRTISLQVPFVIDFNDGDLFSGSKLAGAIGSCFLH